LNGVNPQAYFTDLLTHLVNGWPQKRIDELMPWLWVPQTASLSQPDIPKGGGAPLTFDLNDACKSAAKIGGSQHDADHHRC